MNEQSEQARELLAKQHQEEELRQDAMRSRSAAELHQSEGSPVDAEARKAMAEERSEVEKSQANIRERSEEELQG